MNDMAEAGHPELWSFPGGLRLDAHKASSTAGPIRTLPLPPEFTIPLQQHIGAPAEPLVTAGERVLKGQLVARPKSASGAPIHAPSSGLVVAVTERPVPHPSGIPAPCIVLEPDGEDRAVALPAMDHAAMTPEDIRARIHEAGIVGLGGAVFPTATKLASPAADLLILNGAECEPYISCDDMLMRERAREVVAGARIMMRALGVSRCLIAIEDNKPIAEAALHDAIAQAGANAITLQTVPSIYPEGGERQLIQVLTGREVPSRGLPRDIGVVCQNVGTAAAVHRAFAKGEPLLARVMTITGAGVSEPCNVEARIGTPISWIVEHCGGYTATARRLVMGGPMMGFALPDDAVPVVKATNCILVLGDEELRNTDAPAACIRCGECARVCPASLLPQQLYWFARARNTEKLQEYDLFDCIECGCCDYVCPSHIPLAQYFRAAKGDIRTQLRERSKADHARERFEARQRRLEQEKEERAEKLRRKKEALRQRATEGSEKVDEKTARKTEIAAAVARAKAKHENDGSNPPDGKH